MLSFFKVRENFAPSYQDSFQSQVSVVVRYVQVDSEREMLNRIQSTPGAIGYVESVEESAHVRIIKIR